MLLVDSVLDSFSSLAGMMLSEVASEVWRSGTPVLHYVVFCSAGDREPASSATRRVSWSRSSATLKKASWRARARQAPFLRPLWGGLNTRTRPTRAAYTRARVVRGERFRAHNQHRMQSVFMHGSAAMQPY